MSPVLSSPNAIGKLFIHGTLTKLREHGDVPSYVGIETLQSELVSNAVSKGVGPIVLYCNTIAKYCNTSVLQYFGIATS